MSKGALIAHIWPSGPAMEQELSRRAGENPGGLLLVPPFYTLEGLLPSLLSLAPLGQGQRDLLPWAGPILVQKLLRQDKDNVYAGLNAGHRFPEKLWRLLVEIKAAGVSPRDMAELPGRQVRALAGLFDEYQKALDQLGLVDQADRLDALQQTLEQGQAPPIISKWAGVRAVNVLWLRAMDMRLLTALSRVVDVSVNFAMAPPGPDISGVFGLMKNTAGFFESTPQGRVEIGWSDRLGRGGPLSELAMSLFDPSALPTKVDSGRVELLRESGRYGEVEALVARALDLVQKGVEPSDIALVFPDLELYGQMAADAAGRLGLPLRYATGSPLALSPLAQAVLWLLELPVAGYPRELLARVWESPYLAGPLARLLGMEKSPPADVSRLLMRAGYVDGRESEPGECLRRAAGRIARRRGDLEALAEACKKLKVKVDIFAQKNNLKDYLSLVIDLVNALDIPGEILDNPARPQVQARDLAAFQALVQALEGLERAAGQVALDQVLSPGRLLALARQAFERTQYTSAGGSAQGVWVLPLHQAMGLELHTALIGGLAQGEFPRQASVQNLISSQDRLALGKLAGMAVWRTDEEEYSGQLLRFVWLLTSVRHGAVLSCPAYDAQGREMPPAFVMQELARRLGRDLPEPQGGVFGRLPPLETAREPQALWGGLAQALLTPEAGEDKRRLARAALWHLAQKSPGQARRWRELAARSEVERRREGLNYLSAEKRLEGSDSHSGRLASKQAVVLLDKIISHPDMRRLSPSGLELYAACPMAWFFSYVFKLDIPEEPVLDLERRAEGEWVHSTLARFFDPAEFSLNCEETSQALRLEACLDEAAKELEEHGLAGAPAGAPLPQACAFGRFGAGGFPRMRRAFRAETKGG